MILIDTSYFYFPFIPDGVNHPVLKIIFFGLDDITNESQLNISTGSLQFSL